MDLRKQFTKRPIVLITDGGGLRRKGTLVNVISSVLSCGKIGIVQLREQTDDPASDDEVLELCRDLLPICKKAGVLLILNGDHELAIQAGVDGAHLGKRTRPVFEARRAVQNEFIVGFSAHSLEEATSAERSGANYISLSPIFQPYSKHADVTLGLDMLREVSKKISIPVVALGGIDSFNSADCLQSGAAAVATLSAILLAHDPKRAAKEFLGEDLIPQ